MQEMIRKNQELLNRLNLISDGLLVFSSLFLAFFLRFYYLPGGVQNLPLTVYEYAAGGMAISQMIAYSIIGVYQSQRKRRLRILCVQIILVNLLCIVVLQAVLFLLKLEDFSRYTLLLFFILETVSVCGKHIIVRMLLWLMRKRGLNQKYVILVGSGSSAQNCCNELNRAPELGSQVIGYLSEFERMADCSYLGRPERIIEILDTMLVDEVIVAPEQDEQVDLITMMYACDAAGVRLSLIPVYAGHRVTAVQIDRINNIPLLVMRRVPLDYVFNAAVKRIGDVLGSVFLLVILSPLLFAIFVGVKISSPGPALFRQKRIGDRRKPFIMYKFRSMRVNSEENSAWTTESDDRRTPFGAVLRKWSLDELPQLFNVLKGEMSLVGPRPELPVFVEQFRKDIPTYMVKHLVRPGMTGLAQVNGCRGDTSIEKRIEYDVQYVENWTPWLDVKILVQTLTCLKNDEKLPNLKVKEKSK